MLFALLTFITAFSIEALGTYVSVIGLSTLFGSNPVIIALAVALDVGKLVVVSLLYKHWTRLGVLMKSYALVAAFITMVITSAGAAGYLAGEFQKAIIGTQEGSLKVAVLKEEQVKLEARKKQIDDQIANLPANYSRSRVTLMKEFQDEQRQVSSRLTALGEELPKVQIEQISVEAKAGPILYISKAFEIPVETAVKWVILMIIFVFDPLAVFLIIAGNFLWDQRTNRKKDQELEAELSKFKPEVHGGEFPRAADTSALLPMITEDHIDSFDQTGRGSRVTELPRIEEQHVQEPESIAVATDVPSLIVDRVDRDAGQVDVQEEFTIQNLNEATDALNRRAVEIRGEPEHRVINTVTAPAVTIEDLREAQDRQQAMNAGMSLEAWREMQLRKLDRLQDEANVLAAQLRQMPDDRSSKNTQVLEDDVHTTIRFREPSAQEELVALDSAPQREQITLSSLGLVKADPHTVVDASDTTGLGALDPRVRPDIFPPHR